MIDLLFALALMAEPPSPAPDAPAPPASAVPAPAKTPAAAAPKRANQRMICKRIEPPTGSRNGRVHRVCRTEQEWEDASGSAQRSIQPNLRAYRGPNGGGGD
jgi:hypothetical protein